MFFCYDAKIFFIYCYVCLYAANQSLLLHNMKSSTKTQGKINDWICSLCIQLVLCQNCFIGVSFGSNMVLDIKHSGHRATGMSFMSWLLEILGKKVNKTINVLMRLLTNQSLSYWNLMLKKLFPFLWWRISSQHPGDGQSFNP